jgi:hypothetical protein
MKNEHRSLPIDTMTTKEKVCILSIITTRDHTGRHFTQRFRYLELRTLVDDGLIIIEKPTHRATGIPYDESHWSVEVTRDGQDLVDAYPEYHAEE